MVESNEMEITNYIQDVYQFRLILEVWLNLVGGF